MLYGHRPLLLREINKILKIMNPHKVIGAPRPSQREKALYDLGAAQTMKSKALDDFIFSYKGLLEETGPSYEMKKIGLQQAARSYMHHSMHESNLINQINGWH